MQLGIKSLSILEACLFLYSQSKKTIILGLVWIEGEGVEGSRIELTKNRLILCQFYTTLLTTLLLLPPPSIQITL